MRVRELMTRLGELNGNAVVIIVCATDGFRYEPKVNIPSWEMDLNDGEVMLVFDLDARLEREA